MKKIIPLSVILLLNFFALYGQNVTVKNHENIQGLNITVPASPHHHANTVYKEPFRKSLFHLYQIHKTIKSSRGLMQRLDSLFYEGYETSTSQWYNAFKEDFISDSIGNVTQYFRYHWNDTTSQWDIKWREDYSYDNGNISQFIGYDWDDTTSQWITNWKVEFIFNSNGKLAQFIEYGWDLNTSQWIEDHKVTFIHDVYSVLIQVFEYYWDTGTNQWVNSWKEEYTYDGNGNMILSTDYYWDENTSQWILSHKAEFTYDGSGFLVQTISYEWDQGSSQWISDFKDESVFNSYGDLVQLTGYYWDQGSSNWSSDFKEDYTSDIQYLFEDLIIPYWLLEYEDNFTHMPTGYTVYSWDSNTSQWIPDSKCSFYYSQVNIIGIQEMVRPVIKIFPNPARDLITIETANIHGDIFFELFDMVGRKVISEELCGPSAKIKVNHLESGIYLYHIMQNNIIAEGKIAISHHAH